MPRERSEIDAQARLISALADTISDNDWGSNILALCDQIREAVDNIERVAASRAGGER